jgi:hypothetical protein
MNREHVPVGFLLIAAFYALGAAAVTFTLLTNRDEVGARLAAVHGLTALAGLPIMLLTIAAGATVVVAFCRPRPWAFWLVVAYMVYLLVIPRLVLGPNGISVFANVVWPFFMLAYLLWRHRFFGVGGASERPTSASSRTPAGLP